MASLLELCAQCGLRPPGDYVVWEPFGAIVTEAGERKLRAMAKRDPALLHELFDASGQAIEEVLAGCPSLSRHMRRRLERALRS